jgi:glycerate kinase
MRIVVACDSFKESCSALSACESIARGLREQHPSWDIDICPLADGGEGTVASIAPSVPLDIESVRVTGPLGEPVAAELAWVDGALATQLIDVDDPQRIARGRIALIEAASCLGLALVPERKRNPLMTSSYGLGQLLVQVKQREAAVAIVGLGGTSTVDLGIGMAQAIGVNFEGIRAPAGGGALPHVSAIDVSRMTPSSRDFQVFAACDVRNPLLGARGAARAFAPQKGASPQVVEYLEQGAKHFARQLFEACKGSRAKSSSSVRPQFVTNSPQAGAAAPGNLGFDEGTSRAGAGVSSGLGFDDAVSQAGAGAAGGLGFALQQLLDASLVNGVNWVMRCVKFDERLARADFVVTGEGKLDASSFEGKVVSGVVERAAKRGIPVLAVCGRSALDAQECASRGLSHIETLLEHAQDESDAKTRVIELLAASGGRLASRIVWAGSFGN